VAPCEWEPTCDAGGIVCLQQTDHPRPAGGILAEDTPWIRAGHRSGPTEPALSARASGGHYQGPNVHGMVVRLRVYRTSTKAPHPEVGRFHNSCAEPRSAPATAARTPIVGSESAAQAEALDQRTVALDVDLLQVLEHAATLTDQQQQATTRVVVLLVVLEVFGEA